MKLFYKKDYKIALKTIDKLNSKNVEISISKDTLTKEKENLEKKHKSLENDFKEMLKKSNKLKEENEVLLQKAIEKDKQLKSTQGKLGNKTKIINELNKQIEELELKLKESMSDKYLVKKIPAGKRPNLQKTRVRNKIAPATAKFMKSEEFI